MSRKDYERAAEHVRATHQLGSREERAALAFVVDAFVELFSSDNPRFSASRFRSACKVTQ